LAEQRGRDSEGEALLICFGDDEGKGVEGKTGVLGERK
jgi:hypothetical protein